MRLVGHVRQCIVSTIIYKFHATNGCSKLLIVRQLCRVHDAIRAAEKIVRLFSATNHHSRHAQYNGPSVRRGIAHPGSRAAGNHNGGRSFDNGVRWPYAHAHITHDGGRHTSYQHVGDARTGYRAAHVRDWWRTRGNHRTDVHIG